MGIGDLAETMFAAKLQQTGRAKQRADMVGTERRLRQGSLLPSGLNDWAPSSQAGAELQPLTKMDLNPLP
jgi:hypothetical protein